jgi:hypothetical protein
MPTNRTRRSRFWAPDLDDFRRQELLMGLGYSVLSGKGYLTMPKSAVTEEDRAAAMQVARADWERHGQALTAWWVAGVPSTQVRPWTWVAPGGPGTRPWGWWTFTAGGHPAEGETEPEALLRLKAWLPGERARYLEARRG